MKTSHEMAVSVLRKRDRILRRRRILMTSIGALAGTAAVAAALVITLNAARPRGVDLIDPSDLSTPGNNSIPDVLTDEKAPPLTAASFVENEATGIPQSYEELQDYISPYANVNFLGFEILKRYSAEEAYEITNNDMFLHSTTLYDIHVTYDYFNSQPLDINTKLMAAGTAENQLEGYPPYSEGDKFACFLPLFDPDDINYELSELLFAVDDEEKSSVGYHVGFDKIDFIGKDGKSIADESFTASTVITSTSNNPVTYTDKIPMDTLSGFLRDDWLSRGYTNWTSHDLSSDDIPAGLTDYSSAEIPDISPEERGSEAMGAEHVLLDTKQAGEFSVLLVGEYVTTDKAGHPGMINCFHFGIEIYDGNTVSELSGGPFDLGQGRFWVYTDRLSDYTDVFQIGDNYIIVLRYYDSDGSCRAVFQAIKDGEFYPALMGDYSDATGVEVGVTTWLSENLSVDEELCTITDIDSGISYIFDFDAMSDTYTKPHYRAVKAFSETNMSEQLSNKWLNKWAQISADMTMTLPQASVFSFELKDKTKLVGIVCPSYRTNLAVFYRVSDLESQELGEISCGWQFELLENSTEQYLHIVTKYPGSAANNDSLEIDDEYYLITESSLEPVLRVGRNIFEDKAYDWFVYENEEITHISGEEYEQLKTDALKYGTVVYSTDLDKDGNYSNDEFCAFEDDPEGFKAAVRSVL